MESITNRVNGKHAEAAGGADDEALMAIICRLRECSSSREVIAIVGMPGTGKAALARKAYDHPLIANHFPIRAWSQDYRPTATIVYLLRSMNAEPAEKNASEPEPEYEKVKRLHKTLRKALYGRRYLIVLNDAWLGRGMSRMKPMFPDNGNGSRIIITTRDADLCRASMVNYVHEMRLLDADDTWNLVRQNVFGGDPCPSQLEAVGKVIAGICRGHPLSVQVVSGMLAAADQTVAAWEDISENMNMNGDRDEEDVGTRFLKVLALSYTYLPHYLKPCFLYFGCFLDDRDIRVSKLVKLWVAEGFLNETESKSCEDVGEERVEDLVRRGLVSVTKWKSYSSSSLSRSNGGRRRIKSITIHDLMRDYFNYEEGANLSCRVSTCTYHYRHGLRGLFGSTIRAMILYSRDSEFEYISWSKKNFRLLRILDLLKAHDDDLDDQVFDLFHLRYLAFRCRVRISEAISNLQNLQTLIVCSSKCNVEMFDDLPDGIWRMPQLRHLFVSHFNLPMATNDDNSNVMSMSALEDLQTLSGVVNFICSSGNLKFIQNLRKLALLYMSRDVKQVEDFELRNLIYLHKLQILKIEFDTPFQQQQQHEMTICCAFQFPLTLRKLNLCGVQLPWEDMNKMVASLPNLEVLKLRNRACIGQTWETSEGGFSQLIYLLIEDSNLENWITETNHFPKLKHLVLRRCPSLLEVPNDIGKIPTLELIELDGNNWSLLSTTNRIQKDRQSSGDDRLQIRLV